MARTLTEMPTMVGRIIPKIAAWLHISGQEKCRSCSKIGNMVKHQFCSSRGALNFARCIGGTEAHLDPGQSEELPGWIPADYASD